MPSCAEFGIIDQYLSIKDQIDTGLYPDQPEVDIIEKQKQYVDEILWQEDLKPARNFLDSDTSSWLLEPVMDKLCDLTGPAVGIATTAATATTPSSLHNSPTPVSHKTIVSGMSGGTVTERSSAMGPDTQYESDAVSCGSSDDSSHDLYDLDSQSVPAYCGDDSSSSSSGSSLAYPQAMVKMEQQDWYGGYGGYGGSPYQPQQDQSLYGSQVCFNDGDVQSMMVKTIRDEIRMTAESLCISINPNMWSPEETERWVHDTCLKNHFPTSRVPQFAMAGRDLCQLDLEGFKHKTGLDEVALFLHQSLEIIKMAFQISPEAPEAEQPSFFSDVGDQKPIMCSTDPYHTTSPAPSTGSYSSASSEDDAYMTPSCQPPQAVPHNAPSHVSTPHRGARPGKQTIHLWQFLRELLDDPENYQSCIKWLDRSKGIFKIEDSSKVAKFWGRRKNRPAMNYDKLSRSVRQYYKKGIIRKTEMSKRLVYQFCTPYL